MPLYSLEQNEIAQRLKIQPLSIHQDSAVDNIIFINGFLQQDDENFQEWLDARLYTEPNEHLYGLCWASQSAEDFKRLADEIFVKKNYFHLLRNPWHLAMSNAEKSGLLLGEMLAHSSMRNITLVGHSLGCRVLYYALEALVDMKHTNIIHNVIMLGGAVGNQSKDWQNATKAISGKVYNCFSLKDDVLYYSYQGSSLGLSKPIGYYPIESHDPKIINIDCSHLVNSHFKWKMHCAEIYTLL